MTPVMQVQSQLKANKQEIQAVEAKIQQLQGAGQQYQQRISETPSVQAQMEDIMRDYEASKKAHGVCWRRRRPPRWPLISRDSNKANSSASSTLPVCRTSLRSRTASSSRWRDWRWE